MDFYKYKHEDCKNFDNGKCRAAHFTNLNPKKTACPHFKPKQKTGTDKILPSSNPYRILELCFFHFFLLVINLEIRKLLDFSNDQIHNTELPFGYWISVEEKVLVREFGSSYVDYMKRTNRVTPKII